MRRSLQRSTPYFRTLTYTICRRLRLAYIYQWSVITGSACSVWFTIKRWYKEMKKWLSFNIFQFRGMRFELVFTDEVWSIEKLYWTNKLISDRMTPIRGVRDIISEKVGKFGTHRFATFEFLKARTICLKWWFFCEWSADVIHADFTRLRLKILETSLALTQHEEGRHGR